MTAETDILKIDFAFDDDLIVAPSGDLDIVSGLLNMQNAILRRIMTVPGTILHQPTYGCGLISFQNAPMTLSLQRQIAARIAQNLPLDPRIVEVTNVSITSADQTPEQLIINVTVTLVAYGAQTFKFTPFNSLVV